MTNITELLTNEELKKIAEYLKNDIKDIDELRNLKLEQVKAKLAAQLSLLIGKEAELNEVEGLMKKLETFAEKDWEDSCSQSPSPNQYLMAELPDNKPFIIQATGNNEQKKDTINEIIQSYKQITGKEPTITTYNSANELPEHLKDTLANASFPLTVIRLKFDNPSQLKEFHDKIITPMKNEAKIKLIHTPKKSTELEIQPENKPSRPSFK